MRAIQIRKIRKDLGLTQQEFGDLIGVSGRYIRRLEAGHREPSKLLNKCLELLIKEEKCTIVQSKKS